MNELKKTANTTKKRESIMDGAIKAFVIEGYEKASMDRIAHHAGASKRTVYNHFANKDDLFQAVFKRLLSEQERLKNISYDPNKTLEEQLALFADAEIFLVNDPNRLALCKVLTTVFIQDSELARETKSKYGPPHANLVSWLKSAHEDGRMETPNPRLAAQIFHAMIEGALTWPALFQPCQTDEQLKPLKEDMIKTYLCRFGKNI
ncbi:TetR/AcrR family transcriptional regulator [Chengkuizengella axinellae]|uniref:TetR/AcrR family transcriptional regulator n=1 Tax=Chengkuizengella axinellae TaxID=3064388 RepID=A0ABT9J0L2_9BACL|nr:TetR/AcrR family transcriptional regulator [Chengkuizengella sp. 2205SS18-9]MDP5274952.1 TetR/AcrR family transcriptional regulator [Chengkuizengella sp. 2205SS18-9]